MLGASRNPRSRFTRIPSLEVYVILQLIRTQGAGDTAENTAEIQLRHTSSTALLARVNQNRLLDRYLSIDQNAIGEYFRLAVRTPAVELPSQNYFHSDDETVILSHSHQNRHSQADAPGRKCQRGYPSDMFSLLVGRGNALRNIRQARGLVSFAVLVPVSHNFSRTPFRVRTLFVQHFKHCLRLLRAASEATVHLTEWAD